MSALSVSIPGVQVVGDTHAVFVLSISRGPSSWSVKRRFADFEKLHAAVKRSGLLPPDAGVELPPKTLRLGLSKFDPVFLEDRRAGLEAFLNTLLAWVEPDKLDDLDEFLSLADHVLLDTIDSLGG